MVLLQEGVNLFQGEFSTPTGWLDKPLTETLHVRPMVGLTSWAEERFYSGGRGGAPGKGQLLHKIYR